MVCILKRISVHGYLMVFFVWLHSDWRAEQLSWLCWFGFRDCGANVGTRNVGQDSRRSARGYSRALKTKRHPIILPGYSRALETRRHPIANGTGD